MSKQINERCPLQSECERTCKFQFIETKCDYYRANIRDDISTSSSDFDFNMDFIADEEPIGKLIYINVNQLFPHPDNPRKDLGDLEELAESIKSKGVLQNLTVVPWFSEITRKPLDDSEKQKEMGYRILIGHRRCAAAKLAGLEEVPCVITEMSEHDQVATMLLENMQRSDLSIYEQAQGFQMMLDLGDSVKSIAEHTGFSSSTIRKRINLLQLDENVFKETSSRGATLVDYVALEKIKNIERKNKVLKSIGTSNFNNELKKALSEEGQEKIIDAYVEEISKFATQIDEREETMNYVGSYGCWFKKEVSVPTDINERKYFYLRTSHDVYLYANITEAEIAEKARVSAAFEEAEERIRKKKNQLNEIAKRAFELRFDFIKNFTRYKKNLPTIAEMISHSSINYGFLVDEDIICALENIELNGDRVINDYILQILKESTKSNPERVLLNLSYAQMDSNSHDCLGYRCVYRKNEVLEDLYHYLIQLGYEQSDEEKAYLNGTQELFEKES